MAMGFALDEKRALFVTIRDETNIDADFAVLVEMMDKLDAASVTTGLPAVALIITADDTPSPPANWRSKFGECAKRAQAKKTFVGLITQSSIQRGVLTAIRWLSGSDARTTMSAFVTFEEASLGAERIRGGRLAELAALREVAVDDQRQRTKARRAS